MAKLKIIWSIDCLLYSSIDYNIILKYNIDIAKRIGLDDLFEIFINDLFSYREKIFSSTESYSPFSIKSNIYSAFNISNSLKSTLFLSLFCYSYY